LICRRERGGELLEPLCSYGWFKRRISRLGRIPDGSTQLVLTFLRPTRPKTRPRPWEIQLSAGSNEWLGPIPAAGDDWFGGVSTGTNERCRLGGCSSPTTLIRHSRRPSRPLSFHGVGVRFLAPVLRPMGKPWKRAESRELSLKNSGEEIALFTAGRAVERRRGRSATSNRSFGGRLPVRIADRSFRSRAAPRLAAAQQHRAGAGLADGDGMRLPGEKRTNSIRRSLGCRGEI